MKRIAVITGASSGMGRRFAETVDTFGRFDEIWVIARHEAALEGLRERVPFPVRPLALDLTDRSSFATYAKALTEEPVEVGLLVNASGFGKFRAVVDTPLEVNLNMVDLNCQAVMALCQLTIPYMPEGGQIINIASRSTPPLRSWSIPKSCGASCAWPFWCISSTTSSPTASRWA